MEVRDVWVGLVFWTVLSGSAALFIARRFFSQDKSPVPPGRAWEHATTRPIPEVTFRDARALDDTQPCTWTNLAYLNISDTHGKTFKPYADYMNNLGSEESQRLWSVCLDGLKLFGLTEEHVTNVVGIRLPVRYAKKMSYSSWTMSVGR